MNIDNLVLMANRIGEFFEAMPDRDEALGGIAAHIQRFWALRMRVQLDAWRVAGGEGLTPIVRQALALHAILPVPVAFDADSPAEVAHRHEWDGASES